MRKYKAALLGYYGFGNLGDELLKTACVGLLTSCGVKSSEIVILSNAPDGEELSSVNRWSFPEVVKALRNSECLILGGGGIFQDSTSILSCGWYWGVVRLARLCGCKVWALGQSVGPLCSRTAQLLTTNALNSCRHIHVRDTQSQSVIHNLNPELSVCVGSDLALGLSVSLHERTKSYCLVNLRPHKSTHKFSEILKPHITPETVGAALSDDDVPELTDAGITHIVRVNSLAQAAQLWAGAHEAVGMRLHFGVLSRLFSTPCALMPYDPKVSEFAASSGIPLITDTWAEPAIPTHTPAEGYDTIRSWISTELMN